MHAIADGHQHGSEKGLIRITTRSNEDSVELRLSDSGSGIPAELSDRIFEPFFTTKPVGKGSGQGLALAHTVIVQGHGGSITFESQPGTGTTFIVQLPLSSRSGIEADALPANGVALKTI